MDCVNVNILVVKLNQSDPRCHPRRKLKETCTRTLPDSTTSHNYLKIKFKYIDFKMNANNYWLLPGSNEIYIDGE